MTCPAANCCQQARSTSWVALAPSDGGCLRQVSTWLKAHITTFDSVHEAVVNTLEWSSNVALMVSGPQTTVAEVMLVLDDEETLTLPMRHACTPSPF